MNGLLAHQVAAASGGTVFKGFLLTHLAENVQDAMSPRYGLKMVRARSPAVEIATA